MKVTLTESHTYRLEAETVGDSVFLADMGVMRLARVLGSDKTCDLYSPGSVTLTTKPDSTADLLQTLLKLHGLLRGQAHGQGHVGADAVDPHAQERALAIIKKLNVVLDALGAPVQQAEAVQVVAESHAVPCAEKAIIGTVQRLATDDTEGGAA